MVILKPPTKFLPTRHIFHALWGILICLPFWLYAQPNAQMTPPRIRLNFEAIGPEQGLPHRTVQALYQDRMGFIWMGTPMGLVKYDGYQFRSYVYESSGTIRGEHQLKTINVQAIVEDAKGDLWIGCVYEGEKKPVLFRFDRASEKLIPVFYDRQVDTTVIKSGVRHLHVGQGNLWINANRLYRLPLRQVNSKKDFSYRVFDLEPPDYEEWVTCNIYEDRKGRIWFPGFRGIYQWMPERDSLKFHPVDLPVAKGPPGFFLFELTATGDDGWLMATTSRKGFLLRFNPDDGAYEVVENKWYRPSMYCVMVDQRTLWLGDDIGQGYIAVMDIHRGILREVDVQSLSREVFPYLIVKSMLQDASGNIWIGTQYGPLLKYNPDKTEFHWLPNPYETSNRSAISNVQQASDGSYWMTIMGSGLYHWDSSLRNFQSFLPNAGNSNGLLSSMVLDVEVTEDGSVWFGDLFAVGRYDPDLDQFRHYMGTGSVHTVYEDPQGRIWAGTYEGLRRYDPEQDKWETYNLPPIMGILGDSRGDLWLGHFSFGSYDWKRQGFFRFRPETGELESFKLPRAYSFLEDANRNIWIGTANGLFQYDTREKTFQRFGEADGLPHPVVNGIVEDGKGLIWLATDSGLSCFDPTRQSFRHYDKSDGLPGNLFNSGSFKNRAGELFFWGNAGLLYFHPDSIRDNTIPPKLAFTGLDLFGEPLRIEQGGPLEQHVSLRPEVRFSHRQNDLTIHYAALHFKNPEKNRYQVKLDNYDKEWRDVGNQTFTNYTNLDPGRYVFRVKAANSDGVWNEEAIALPIRIRPPWYWNVWTQALYLALIIILVAGGYRILLSRRLAQAEARRLQDLDSMKTQLYTNITHEFRTPLSVILGTVDNLGQRVKQTLDAELEVIRRNGRQLLEMVNRMLELSKLDAGKLNLQPIQGDVLPFLRYVTESFHSFALNQKINLIFYSEEKSILMDYDPEKLLPVLSNLLSNALKFTPEYGTVQVVARRSKESSPGLALEFRDTGMGISAEELPHIFDRFFQSRNNGPQEGTGIGLALVKELVELMKGKIEVKSRAGEGTVFFVWLPITQKAESAPPPKLPELGAHSPPAIAVPASAGELATGEKPLVLLVEDNIDLMNYLTTCLERDYRLLYARNGREGIEQARRLVPDMIISDVMMPEIDGFELCRTLKTDERTSHIPIILLTAKADEVSRLEGLETGADAYLVKPFVQRELQIRLQKLIELRQHLQKRYRGYESTLPPFDIQYEREDEFLQKVRKTIEAHLEDENFGVEQLYSAVGVSRVQLYRKLKALTGHSPARVIRGLRLHRARYLLRTTELRVGEVARYVGFKDQGYFTKIYKKEFGELPSENKA